MSIVFVIQFDHPSKKRAVMQKANVSHGKSKMDKLARRRELPCIRRLVSSYRGRVVRSAVLMLKEKKKG
jgi:hypothetical protein